MKKKTAIPVILAVVVVACFALASLAQAGSADTVTEGWAKNNLVNKKKAAKIPIWQITQDGTAQAVNWVNAANPRFAVYDFYGDSTDVPDSWVDDFVLDKETGLVWERHPARWAQVGWYNAIEHCYIRQTGNRLGWRPPTIEELSSLVDKNRSSPALPDGHPFYIWEEGVYWASTTSPGDTGTWSVNFSTGTVGWSGKGATGFYIWCVRGGTGHDGY